MARGQPSQFRRMPSLIHCSAVPQAIVESNHSSGPPSCSMTIGRPEGTALAYALTLATNADPVPTLSRYQKSSYRITGRFGGLKTRISKGAISSTLPEPYCVEDSPQTLHVHRCPLANAASARKYRRTPVAPVAGQDRIQYITPSVPLCRSPRGASLPRSHQTG